MSNLFILIKSNFPYYLEDLCYQFGFNKLVKYIDANGQNYNKIVITDDANQPFIFFLFYQKYPPKKLLNSNIIRIYPHNSLFQQVISFDKYKFCNLNTCYNPNENNLYIARAKEIPNIKAKHVIHNLDGSVFRIIDNK